MSQVKNRNIQKLHKEVGAYFCKKRVQNKFTQKEVADFLGIHSQYISNFERGISPPSNQNKKKLLKLYRVDPKEFFDFMMEQQAVFLKAELGIKTS